MKNVLLLLILLTTTFASAQITRVDAKKDSKVEIGKITPKGILSIKVEKINNEHYIFTYKDTKHNQGDWREFKINSEEDFDAIYDIIMEGFDEMPSEPIVLNINNAFIFMHFSKSFGVDVVRFSQGRTNAEDSITGSTDLYNKIQVQRLFNKK